MPVAQEGAQRASRQRSVRFLVLTVLAAALAVGGIAAHPQVAAAACKKVVIAVGPAGGTTSNSISNAKRYARQARSYGATVYEIYSPHATWARVKQFAQGANILIYLGHGNGWPTGKRDSRQSPRRHRLGPGLCWRHDLSCLAGPGTQRHPI